MIFLKGALTTWTATLIKSSCVRDTLNPTNSIPRLYWLTPMDKRQKEMANNIENLFIFVCPNCGHEFTHKFTDDEIKWAEGLLIEITSAQCEKCSTWVEPKKINWHGNLSLYNQDNKPKFGANCGSVQCLSFRGEAKGRKDRANAWLYEKRGRGSFWNHLKSWCTDRP